MATVGTPSRFRLAQIFLRFFPFPYEPAQGPLLIFHAADDTGAGCLGPCRQW